MGSHRPSRVHARSDVREPIDEATMQRRNHLREKGGGEARGISSAKRKTILWAFFFRFVKSKIANS